MKTYVEETKELYLAGKKGQAFKRLGKMNNLHLLSKEEKKVLVIAGEMLAGMGKFYEQLGYNKDKVAEEAEVIFKRHFDIK